MRYQWFGRLASARVGFIAISAFSASWLAGSAFGANDPSPFKDCEHCPEMVLIPAGSFTMGSTPAETAAAGLPKEQGEREQPAHRVTIANPFAISRYEVTVGEYRAFAEDTSRAATANCITWDSSAKKWQAVAAANWQSPGYEQTNRHPVGCLTLDDAESYAAWLSTKTGKRYRIPTEAEWEYVARAGTTTEQSWGDNEDICKFANVSDATRRDAHEDPNPEPSRFFSCADGYVYNAPVGSFPPNQWGVYDMVGNIWEWVEDCFITHYNGAPTDGSAWMVPGCERRIVRGGGWYARTWFSRPAGRSREHPDYLSSTLGLRMVREGQ